MNLFCRKKKDPGLFEPTPYRALIRIKKMLRTTNIPSGEPLSEDFSVLLNGKPVQLYQVRVSAMPFCHTFLGAERSLDQTETASLLSFSADEPVRVELVPKRKFDKVVIRPLSRKVQHGTENGKITFTLSSPGQYVVELDDYHNALHIFFDPVKDFGILPDSKNTIYFGPGIHHPGQIVLTDGMTVYIDQDAVVYGSFLAYGSRDIRILGNGVLCGSWYDRKLEDLLQLYDIPREAKRCYESPRQREAVAKRFAGIESSFCNMETYVPGTGTYLFRNREQFGELLEKVPTIKAGIHFYVCDNVEVNGIILKDAVGMTNTIIACEHVVYDNVKTIGMWRYNTDGINFYNSRNCVVRNSFVRSFDDGICMKGKPGYDTVNTENILVENCVLWTDWGNSLEFGVNTVAPEICHITYRACDVIHHSQCVMDLGNQDRADIHDILFEDIRVEYSVHDLSPVIQGENEKTYEPRRGISMLVRAIIACSLWSSDDIAGKNHHITFRNIQVFTEDNMQFPPIMISGKDPEHTNSDFVFENIIFNGKRLKSKQELNLSLGDFVDDSEIKLL